MKWTNTYPKTTGYYWYRDSLSDGEGVVLEVSKEGNRLCADGGELCFSFKAGEKATPNEGVQWGNAPIPLPKGPKFKFPNYDEDY